jgi:HPt (histidine-containing phosphotransfer) domain-containing protein
MSDTTLTVPREMIEALAVIERIGGLDLIAKLTSLFEQSSRDRASSIEAFLVAGDRRQVSRTAHAVKGSAAQVGAESLRALASALEKEAEHLDAVALQERVDALNVEVERSIALLRTFVRERGGSA